MRQAPQLGDEAKEEMPGAQDKVSGAKGSFLLWVIRIMAFIIVVVCPLVYFDLKSANKQLRNDLKDCNSKYEKYVNWLEGLRDRVDKVDEKADTALNKAQQKNK